MIFSKAKESLMDFAETWPLKKVFGGIALGILLGNINTGDQRIDLPVACVGGIIFLTSVLSPAISQAIKEYRKKNSTPKNNEVVQVVDPRRELGEKIIDLFDGYEVVRKRTGPFE